MLQPGGRVHADLRLPREVLRSPSGHAGGRGLSQVDAHTGCAPGGAGGRVDTGAARLQLAQEDRSSLTTRARASRRQTCVARSATACKRSCAPARAGRMRTQASPARTRTRRSTLRSMRERGWRAAPAARVRTHEPLTCGVEHSAGARKQKCAACGKSVKVCGLKSL